jgi:hypothetical protein
MPKHIVKEVCEECGGVGSWDSTPFPNYYVCESCDGEGEVDVVLNEFFVTETYIVKARTIEEAQCKVLDNDVDDVDNYSMNVEPNIL